MLLGRAANESNAEGGEHVNIRNEIKSYIVREGVTMSDLVRKLAIEHGWSASIPNFSDKLKRGTLRYSEAIQLADVLGYNIVWQRRGGDSQ